MNKIFLLWIFSALFIWAVAIYSKRKRKVKVIKANGSPFIAPPEGIPEIKLNRQQRRRMNQQQRRQDSKFMGKKLRDELRQGKIIESNEFLKTYFNGKK